MAQVTRTAALNAAEDEYDDEEDHDASKEDGNDQDDEDGEGGEDDEDYEDDYEGDGEDRADDQDDFGRGKDDGEDDEHRNDDAKRKGGGVQRRRNHCHGGLPPCHGERSRIQAHVRYMDSGAQVRRQQYSEAPAPQDRWVWGRVNG